MVLSLSAPPRARSVSKALKLTYKQNLNALVTHTCQTNLFPVYAQLIMLHHAHPLMPLGRAGGRCNVIVWLIF